MSISSAAAGAEMSKYCLIVDEIGTVIQRAIDAVTAADKTELFRLTRELDGLRSGSNVIIGGLREEISSLAAATEKLRAERDEAHIFIECSACLGTGEGKHDRACARCGGSGGMRKRTGELLDACETLRAENERLKRGDFTPEEFQNLCHKFSETEREAFCAGCAEYQKKLFGESDRERLTKERDAIRLAFSEASHLAGPAFCAHEALRQAEADRDRLAAVSLKCGEELNCLRLDISTLKSELKDTELARNANERMWAEVQRQRNDAFADRDRLATRVEELEEAATAKDVESFAAIQPTPGSSAAPKSEPSEAAMSGQFSQSWRNDRLSRERVEAETEINVLRAEVERLTTELMQTKKVLDHARELLREVRDGEVNPEDIREAIKLADQTISLPPGETVAKLRELLEKLMGSNDRRAMHEYTEAALALLNGGVK